MIIVKELHKTFENNRVLRGVNYHVHQGEKIVIIGPSGSGKSTFLRCLNLLETPTSGEIWFDGQLITSPKANIDKVREHMGMVFQNFNLIDELTVEQNVELPLTYLGIPREERKRRVKEALERMNIGHRAHHRPQQLSGGQQQRVAIARAVITDPQIILADEPTGNLDSTNGKEVMELLIELNRGGTTIVMVTHSKHDAAYARRIVNLFDGTIVSVTEN